METVEKDENVEDGDSGMCGIVDVSKCGEERE